MDIDNDNILINNDFISDPLKQTPEDIEEILRLANINASNILPVVQSLYSFVSLDEGTSEYKVLELDDHLLESVKVGDSLSFRGDKKESVILCSETRTYEVKEAESSNVCLIVPNLKCKNEIIEQDSVGRIIEEVEVKGSFNTYLEVRECSPKLSKLLIILEPSSFKGLEVESQIDSENLYDWDRIVGEIQASNGEILAALPNYLITCMDGYYRLVSFEFEARALTLMLDLIEENSWSIDEINKEISYDSLKEIIPEPIFDVLFQKYAEPSEKKTDDGIQLYRYCEAKCSRLLAQILLSRYPENDYYPFMDAWQAASPDIIPPKEEYLYGIAIVRWNDQSMKKEVILYPEADLPLNINQRLNELFTVKAKWTVPEITPYISKFTTRHQDVNAILTKYARPSTVNGIKYYSSKHLK